MATSKDKKTTGEAKPTASSGTKKTTVTQAAKNSAKAADNAKASTLPSAEALKERFKAGSIPLQTDFADLIDVANVGRLAVGDEEAGWGLEKDSHNRLQYNPNSLHDLSYDLSPCSDPDEQFTFTINEFLKKGNQIAILALDEIVGPVSAINTQDDGVSTTTFKLPAIKIDSSGVRSLTTVSIIADKSVGKGSERKPLEYVKIETSPYSIWYSFRLDTSKEDFSNCTLSINPLMLVCKYIPAFGTDSVGETISALRVSFVYNSSREIIPKGLISMFSGTAVPGGWALCDGKNGTPDLIDRFVMAGTVSPEQRKSTKVFSGEDNNKILSFYSAPETIAIKGTTEGHALTAQENGPHSHLAGIAVEHTSKCLNDSQYISQAVDWLNAGGSARNPGKYDPRTYPDGSGEPHRHDINITNTHGHTNNVTIPYYILAFIIKL